MYPSDRVWNNVYGSLHNRRRWFAIGLVLLLITSALMVSREVMRTGQEKIASNGNATPRPAVTIPNNDNTAINYPNNIGLPAYKGPTASSRSNGHSNWNNAPVPAMVATTQAPLLQDEGALEDAVKATDAAISAELLSFNSTGLPANIASNGHYSLEPGQQDMDNDPATGGAFGNASLTAATPTSETSLRVAQVERLSMLKSAITVSRKNKPFQNDFGTIQVKIPFRDRWSMKIYGGPIVSYRRLSDLSRGSKSVPVLISYSGNIDNYVQHKPAVGFELGSRVMYKLTPSLGVFSGVQMNYSRYYIDAYRSSPERAVLAVTSSSAGGVDTSYRTSSIRNFGGYSPEQLTNQYLQVSVPIGAELKLLGNSRVQLGIAAAVQPTYLLASSTYLLSSDFKNYIPNSDLIRRFNLHTNFEAFISYETASGLRWQLGPQFRYQVFSSYSNKYPIREYITEFGIKLGITRIFK